MTCASCSGFRWGYELPDDDAGRSDLFELLNPISLGHKPFDQMLCAVEMHAPWLDQVTAEQMIEAVLNLPFSARAPDGVTLGQRLRLTNAERERLRLWTIAPCDMSAEDMAEQRKAKARERMRRYRAKRGAKTRAEYRGNSIAKTKPWQAEGVSRRTWYRHQKKTRDTSPCAERIESGTGRCATKEDIITNALVPSRHAAHSARRQNGERANRVVGTLIDG